MADPIFLSTEIIIIELNESVPTAEKQMSNVHNNNATPKDEVRVTQDYQHPVKRKVNIFV